jgi:hypothetical protein
MSLRSQYGYKGKREKNYFKKFPKNLIHRRDLDPDPDLNPQLEKTMDPH